MHRDAIHARDGLAHVPDEALEVLRARLSVIDDEVGVLLRYRGVTDAKALESRGLDEARGMIARWIGEHRATAPLTDRLRGLALREQLLHLAAVRPGAGLEAQLRADEPLIRDRGAHLAVAHLVLRWRTPVHAPVAVDGLQRAHVRPGLTA